MLPSASWGIDNPMQRCLPDTRERDYLTCEVYIQRFMTTPNLCCTDNLYILVCGISYVLAAFFSVSPQFLICLSSLPSSSPGLRGEPEEPCALGNHRRLGPRQHFHEAFDWLFFKCCKASIGYVLLLLSLRVLTKNRASVMQFCEFRFLLRSKKTSVLFYNISDVQREALRDQHASHQPRSYTWCWHKTSSCCRFRSTSIAIRNAPSPLSIIE